ncbi:hypothetical protein CERZMDRAFT_90013 [Cercospora zeae-maydis SCOH1-5]|uniref:Uncharacterized protein n=1 Tax=Cercospora zeae-maydis SCOH1-5 TaxID=717836 RepID=A0A6A6FR60_9PEZI|nr:hypothetical protein CERZMDRAFT_90013 [Cercospora zeae-maydis SCOH1-5]
MIEGEALHTHQFPQHQRIRTKENSSPTIFAAATSDTQCQPILPVRLPKASIKQLDFRSNVKALQPVTSLSRLHSFNTRLQY